MIASNFHVQSLESRTLFNGTGVEFDATALRTTDASKGGIYYTVDAGNGDTLDRKGPRVAELPAPVQTS